MGDPSASAMPLTPEQQELLALRTRLSELDQAGVALQQQVATLLQQSSALQQQNFQQAATLQQHTPHPSAPSRLPTLEKYSGAKGEDLLAWMFQIEEQFTLHRVQDDETRIIYAGSALIQNAKTWYRSARTSNSLSTWEAFVSGIKAHFYPINPVKMARDQLHSLTQTTSVRDYTASFRHLCTIIGTITNEEMLDRYVRGLKTRTRSQVELQQPASFEEACKLAEIIDVTNDRIFGNSQVNNRPRRSGPEPMEVVINAINEKPKFKKLTPEEKERRKRLGLCNYCGADNHKLDNCPLRKPQGKGQQRQNGGAH